MCIFNLKNASKCISKALPQKLINGIKVKGLMLQSRIRFLKSKMNSYYLVKNEKGVQNILNIPLQKEEPGLHPY